MNNLALNKHIDKKWKNKKSGYGNHRGFYSRHGMQYGEGDGGYWTPEPIPTKIRRRAKSKYLRKYYKKLMDDEFRDLYAPDPYLTDDDVLTNRDLYDIPPSIWKCNVCTYTNSDDVIFCAMCNHPYTSKNNTSFTEEYKFKITRKRKFRRKRKRIRTRTKLKTKSDPKENTKSYDIKVSIEGIIRSHIAYVKDKFFINRSKQKYFAHVPMHLMNMQILKCSLKITDKQFDFTPFGGMDILMPVYMPKHPFLFDYDFMCKKNKKMFNLINQCLAKFRSQSIDELVNVSACHYTINDIFFDYLPASSVIEEILCAYLGYNEFINIDAKIRNIKMDASMLDLVGIDNAIFIKSCNEASIEYDDKHWPSHVDNGKVPQLQGKTAAPSRESKRWRAKIEKEIAIKEKRKKIRSSSNFATYWEEMKENYQEFKQKKKRIKAKMDSSKKSLNFYVHLVRDEVENINVGRILFEEVVKIKRYEGWWRAYSAVFYSVKCIVTHNPNRAENNFNKNNVHCSFWTHVSKNSTERERYVWKYSVEEWKKENAPTMGAFILQRIGGKRVRPGFEYLRIMSDYH